MRIPITKASFHPSVGSWSYQQFKDRFSGQMTNEEIEYFAKELGIPLQPEEVAKPKKGKASIESTIENIAPYNPED